MSQRVLILAKQYRLLMSIAGFNNDNEFLDNFNSADVIHQQIQATRLAYFEEAKHVYGLD